MAFVYRQDKQPAYIKESTTKEVGPGAYQGPEELQINSNFAPFNSLAERGEDQQKPKILTPGPGQYNIQQSNLNEKVVVSSANEDIKIVEVPKPQAMFKSGTNRFKQGQHDTPGPGEYDVQQAITQIKQQWPESKQKQDILDKLMKMNKYQSIPSIPGKVHAFGYTENETNELELNKLPPSLFTGIKGDVVGPGQYNLKSMVDTNQNKGTNKWSKSKVERFQQQARQTKSVGPGQYDVQSQFMPLYKLKQSVGFASKTLRSSEQRKGQVVNQFLKQRSIQSSDTTMRTRGGTDFDDEETDSEYEYIEDATPGPGHYSNESIITAIKPQTKQEKFQFFGSGQVRFKEKQQISHTGPGDYRGSEKSCFQNKKQLQRIRKPPFQSSNTRFEFKSIQDQKPGPTTYNPRQTLEDKLINKIQKGYRGNFGTTENRFKLDGMEEYPGPGAYLDPIQEKEGDDQVPTASFKSNIKRGAFNTSKEQKKKPPVGAYNIDYFDINRNIHKEDEDDVDLKMPYPPFGSSIKDRFPDPKPVQIQDNDDDDQFDSYPMDKQLADQYKVKPKQDIRFGSKAQRFNYKNKVNNNPGPGKYHDPNFNPWNKRTYNILFAEI